MTKLTRRAALAAAAAAVLTPKRALARCCCETPEEPFRFMLNTYGPGYRSSWSASPVPIGCDPATGRLIYEPNPWTA